MKQKVQFQQYTDESPLFIAELGRSFTGMKVTVFLEVEGAAHYLPAYAGNLDIMTSAALATAESIVRRQKHESTAAEAV
jgi:acetaldehyde dehydrogenase